MSAMASKGWVGLVALCLLAGCATANPGAGAAAGLSAGSHTAGNSSRTPAAQQTKGGTSSGSNKQVSSLTGVACPSVTGCSAAGWYSKGTAVTRTLVGAWNGHTWRAAPGPDVGHRSSFNAISCPSSGNCVAVGTLAATGSGTQWSPLPTPPAGMTAISCAAPGNCQAVGAVPGRHLVAARWQGRGWRRERVPLLRPRPQTATLSGVSCVSTTFCVAVGDGSSGAGALPSPKYRDRTLAEIWNGHRWRVSRTPNPRRRSALSAVSCVSRSDCMAVGSSDSGQLSLAEHWNGTAWAIVATPNVNHVGYTALAAVSCASVSVCVAVGTYNGGVRPIAEYWNGARWTLGRLALPQGVQVVQGLAVSCASSTFCMMVATADATPLSEVWNGVHWAVLPVR